MTHHSPAPVAPAPVWPVLDSDRELFDRELDSFVPTRIFDAHTHLYSARHFPEATRPPMVNSGPIDVTFAVYRQHMEELIPNRVATHGLFFPFPHADVDVAAENDWLYRELADQPGARGQMLVTAHTTPDEIRAAVRDHGIVGLKCYHVYSVSRPTFESPVEDFLPEPQVAVCHELGLSITLHMVRARALADPVNQATIRRYCETYPNMRMILAHAARGFNPHHTLLGIHSLAGLRNCWFDTSVVTDSGAIEAIARTMGHDRILYGSDFPVTHIRGRCVAIGDSFFWMSAENTRLEAAYAKLELALVGHEALRTLKVAALALGWSDTQVEDVFYNNAARLYGLA